MDGEYEEIMEGYKVSNPLWKKTLSSIRFSSIQMIPSRAKMGFGFGIRNSFFQLVLFLRRLKILLLRVLKIFSP